MNIRVGKLQNTFYKFGYDWFDEGDYNLNLVGIRAKDNTSNTFNDFLCVAYRVDGIPHFHAFKATTDPGKHWLLSPMRVDGTAVVQCGQHKGLWKLGLHQGKYEALVQNNPVTVIRDNNKNDAVDCDGESHRGFFGINCHRARSQGESKQVDKWSAGCQVLANAEDFDLLMALCRKSKALYGDSFTYTLIDEVDLWTP